MSELSETRGRGRGDGRGRGRGRGRSCPPHGVRSMPPVVPRPPPAAAPKASSGLFDDVYLPDDADARGLFYLEETVSSSSRRRFNPVGCGSLLEVRNISKEDLLFSTHGLTRRCKVPLGPNIFLGQKHHKEFLVKVLDKLDRFQFKEIELRLKYFSVRAHNNLVRLIGSCSDDRYFYLVFDLPQGGCLFDKISDCTISFSNAINIASAVSKSILHILTSGELPLVPDFLTSNHIWFDDDGSPILLDLADFRRGCGNYFKSMLEITRAFGLLLLHLIKASSNSLEEDMENIKALLKIANKCVDEEENQRPSMELVVEEIDTIRTNMRSKTFCELKLSDLPVVEATQIQDDPYTVTDKCLLKENLPLTYHQQAVESILQNCGQNNFVPDPSFRDPYTVANTYVPGKVSSTNGNAPEQKFKHIPKSGMLLFWTADFYGIIKKVTEFSTSLSSDLEQKQLSLSETEMTRLHAIVKVLKETPLYHTSKLADADMALLVKILKSWPPQMMFPVIHFLAMFVLHPDGAALVLRTIETGNDVLMETFHKAVAPPVQPLNLHGILKAMTNLFNNSCLHQWLRIHSAEMIDSVCTFKSSFSKDAHLAYATLLLNYALLSIELKDEQSQGQILRATLEITKDNTQNFDSKYRALVAIGSLMANGLVKSLALDLDVKSVASSAKSSLNLKIVEVGADIELLARSEEVWWNFQRRGRESRSPLALWLPVIGWILFILGHLQ